ncbi:hypothetical protein BGZ51_002939 [Haplosporangium sp. Z 767]|nr:hypothetical protein BGZ50_003742 [Haplosporangium sp. Z 11]KAF9185122.1 hypothetical protein BGZ51_002939 [Haplosporangium sp. Z 767]
MLGRLPLATLVVLAMVLSLLIADTVHAVPKPVHKPAPKPSKTPVSLKQLTKAFAGNCPQKTVGEVITCKDALPFINAAIKKYGLKTRGQRAAYIANMAYEGGYLKYNRNLVVRSQGTRSIMPAVSLRRFVDANKSVQRFWPRFPNDVDDNTIVDVLINRHADFEPGAWWTVAGPGCAEVASRLNGSQDSFVAWETACINGGVDTIPQRAAIYKTVYAAIQ